MKNRMAEMRLMQYMRVCISQSKQLAIELKNTVDQKNALSDKINQSRRNLFFYVDGTLTISDVIGQMYDYNKLDEISKKLSIRLASSTSIAVSLLCELINDKSQEDTSLSGLSSDISQIGVLVSNTCWLCVDYSSIVSPLSKTLTILSERKDSVICKILADRIFEILKKIG